MIVYVCVKMFLRLYGMGLEQPFVSMCFFLSCCETVGEILFLLLVGVPSIVDRVRKK